MTRHGSLWGCFLTEQLCLDNLSFIENDGPPGAVVFLFWHSVLSSPGYYNAEFTVQPTDALENKLHLEDQKAWRRPLLFMEGRWTLPLFLGAYLVLLASEVRLITGQGIYTNTWAVHIEGGAEEAERIAQKHGFISHGQVSGINALSKIHLLFLVRVAMFVYVDIMLHEVCSDVLVHHSPSCRQALLLYTRGRQICTNTHAPTICDGPSEKSL